MKKQNYVFKLVQDESPESPRDGSSASRMVCNHKGYNLGDEQSSDPFNLCSYETKEERYLAWIFDKFITPSETCPELLKGWYLWGGVFGKDQDVHLNEFLPKSFIEAIEQWVSDNLAILPLYLYDHSGTTINTTGFGCRFDSGQVGYIYTTKESYEHTYSEPFDKVKALEWMLEEVSGYDQFLTGEVYGRLLYKVEDAAQVSGLSLSEATLTYNLYEAGEEFDTDATGVEELEACWGFYGADYARSTCLEDFPAVCLIDSLGDYSEIYKIYFEDKTLQKRTPTRILSRAGLIDLLGTISGEVWEDLVVETYPKEEKPT